MVCQKDFGGARPPDKICGFALSSRGPHRAHAMTKPNTPTPDQTDMRAQQSAGEVMKTSQIETIVLPRMRGMQYLGPAYDSRSQIYTLKFMNRDRVIFVEVDGRTGSVLRQR